MVISINGLTKLYVVYVEIKLIVKVSIFQFPSRFIFNFKTIIIESFPGSFFSYGVEVELL